MAEESLEIARTLDDPDAIGAALLSLGIIECDANNLDLAEALQLDALSVFSASDNESEVRKTLGMLGFLYIARSDYSEAKNVCEKALELSRSAGDKRGTFVAASNLGHVLGKEGRIEEALGLQREALALTQELFDLQGTGEILLDIAKLAIARGRCVDAGTLLGAVGALAESTEFALVSVEIEWFDEMTAVLRRELGGDGLDLATARGRQMPLDDVMTYAVEFIDSSM